MPSPSLQTAQPASLRSRASLGDVAALQRDFASAGGRAAWTRLVTRANDRQQQRTLVHHALQGQFSALNDPSLTLSRLSSVMSRHAAALDIILKGTSSLSLWCPLVDALHYGLIGAVETLLARMSAADTLTCLEERDAYGQTLLYTVVQSKSSGLARRLLRGGAALQQVGIHIDAALPSVASPPLRQAELNLAAGERGLALVLDAARRVAQHKPSWLGPWLDSRDQRGRTALHHACRAGRAKAVAALLAVGAEVGAREDEWGGTCGHTAAARGHTDVLEAWRAAGGKWDDADQFGRTVERLHDGGPWRGEPSDDGQVAASNISGLAEELEIAGWRPPTAAIFDGLGGSAVQWGWPPTGLVSRRVSISVSACHGHVIDV